MSASRGNRMLAYAARLAGVASLALLGCAAERPHVHGPFLVNHSGAALELRVQWLDAHAEACEMELARLVSELAHEDASAEHVLALEHTQTARLTRLPGFGANVVSRCPSEADGSALADAGLPRCVIARIRGDDLRPHLIRADAYWESTDERTRCQPFLPVYEHPGQGAVVIRPEGAERALTAYAHVELLAL